MKLAAYSVLAFAFALLDSALSAQEASSTRLVHVFVALCDNASQGIQPVPAKIGNGNDPANNLYWGCDEGLKRYFARSKEWKLLDSTRNASTSILERAAFQHTSKDVVLIADAYRGSEIRRCIEDFLSACAGELKSSSAIGGKAIPIGGAADLVAFMGHNGLMDFSLDRIPKRKSSGPRQAIVLCCKSEQYFAEPLARAGVEPLLTTTQLMYPGSFILKNALDGWLEDETNEQIRDRAAEAYAANQKIGLKSARGVFATAPQRARSLEPARPRAR